METLTVITPTGDRPLAFALCQNWARKQTLRPDQWIVVDDGKIPIEPYVSMEYMRREPQPSDPQWIPDIDNYNIYMDIVAGKLTEENYQSWLKK